jgi:hypothetical protein
MSDRSRSPSPLTEPAAAGVPPSSDRAHLRCSRARSSTVIDEAPSPPGNQARKCPFLAGRPPHGSHHMWPSGVNVCYARPREAKPYGPVSKETQTARCLCGSDAYEGCSDFASARERGLELPVFGGPASGRPARESEEAPRRGVRRERHRRRHRRSSIGLWLAKYSQSPLACVLWLLLMALTVWLAVRTR